MRVRIVAATPLVKDPIHGLVKRRNLVWGVAWPSVICVFAAVGSAAFIWDSRSLLVVAYAWFAVGFVSAAAGGAYFQSRIVKRRFERWRLDDSVSLVRLMEKTMPVLFAASLFFLVLAREWRELPGSTAIIRIVATVAIGGILLWVALAFAARAFAKEQGMQKAFRLSISDAANRLRFLAGEGKGSLGKVNRHPLTRQLLRVELSTPNGVLRAQRLRSRGVVVKVLLAEDWDALAAMWEGSLCAAPAGT